MAEEFVIAGWMDYGANRDKVLAAFIEAAVASRTEAGCLDYRVYADPEDTGRIFVFERWVSEQDLVEHFEMPHIASFRAAIADCARHGRDIRRYFISRDEEFTSSRVRAGAESG
jgi:quinol monooxygenase YgiN